MTHVTSFGANSEAQALEPSALFRIDQRRPSRSAHSPDWMKPAQ
jgi:hypothetical protein